jgi:cyclopropane-fatty-acyl-phospholipid synthase
MDPNASRTVAVPVFSRHIARDSSNAVDRWAIGRVQRVCGTAPVRLVLWDGFEAPSMESSPSATILVKNRPALFGLLWDPELYFGEAYMSGALEVRGDLASMLEQLFRALGSVKPRAWWSWPRSNGLTTARVNVHHHYDLGNDFYRLWLDREMAYTCAYFPTPDTTLDAAQVAKMDLICRKLHVQPGDRVVEAGCGWGSMALFMARHYGALVRAYNISAEQIDHARARARREGLADRVQFVEDDYRNVRGQYDVFLSVGMLEHVGLADYPTLGRVIDRSLTARGRGLLHFLGRNTPSPMNAWIRKRIFPGSYGPALREVCEHVLEPTGLSILDVDNLRLHYATTLGHWLRRFELASDRVQEMFDETFVRAWRLYLASSQASFSTGSMQLFQVVFARGNSNAIPWTRSTPGPWAASLVDLARP